MITNCCKSRARTKYLPTSKVEDAIGKNDVITVCDIVCGSYASCPAVSTSDKTAEEICDEIIVKYIMEPIME